MTDLSRREISKVTALTNPVSGHGAAVAAAQTAIARLHHRGVEVVEIIGDSAEDARYLVSAALDKGTDAVMVTGGDGVISNALQVLAGTDVPLGIIPAGTGNDHAREFGIPTKDPEAAADIIVDGWTETIDLGRIQRRNGKFDKVVRHRGGGRIRFPGHRSRQPDALAARAAALLPRDDRRTVAVAAVAVPVGARRNQRNRRRHHARGLRQYPQLWRRAADLPRRRPHRRAARHHHGALGFPDQAGPAVPHRHEGHPCRARRGEHGTRQVGPRRVPGHQRVRRRRLRLPAARRDFRGARAHCRFCGRNR